MATVLPENITDITDVKLLDQTLNNMIGCTSGVIFVIKNGFIYATHNGPDEYQNTELLFIRLDDIQEVYSYYKKNTTESSRLYANYNIGFNYTRISGREYLKLGGSFTLINASYFDIIDEKDDLIFESSYKDKSFIVRVAADYFSVPNDIHEGAVRPYTPIKSIVKFNKLQKMSGEKYFKHEYNYRHVVDPYDARVSFVCADTLDIVNPETGERVKTWKLILFLFSNWAAIKNDIENRNYIWTANIDTKKAIHLLYDEHWERYYILNGTDFHELRSRDSGKLTKAAITEAE
jgi:hypothetical protein